MFAHTILAHVRVIPQSPVWPYFCPRSLSRNVHVPGQLLFLPHGYAALIVLLLLSPCLTLALMLFLDLEALRACPSSATPYAYPFHPQCPNAPCLRAKP